LERILARHQTWQRTAKSGREITVKYLRSTIVLWIVIAVVVRAEVPAGWSTNFTAAVSAAGSNQEPVLVFFTASWCGPCRMMARTTLTNEAVVHALSTVTHVALDIDEHPDLAQQHDVRAVPTFAILANGGGEVDRTTGYQSPAEFLDWLTNGVSEARENAAQLVRLHEQLATADQLLTGTNADSTLRAATELFELCAERDSATSQAAISRLKSLGARDPRLLLDGLRDRRLAVRIQVANILRERLGDGFDVDPWSDAASCKKAIETWRKKLSASATDNPDEFR
jgi:thioredoxin-like negative regulator of GroEL